MADGTITSVAELKQHVGKETRVGDWHTVTQEEITAYLTPLVAKWWLPDEVRFVDEIPKTSVGKFDKKVIREQALKAPAAARPSE